MNERTFDLEHLVETFAKRLPSRAFTYVAKQKGITKDRLKAQYNIDDGSAEARLRDVCDIEETIRSALEVVLLLRTDPCTTEAAFSVADEAFRRERNPLVQVAEMLL